MILAAFEAEPDEEVLKWLSVAVATSVSQQDAARALDNRLKRGVSNGNARDWIETALARVASPTSIGRARKAIHLLEEHDLKNLLAKAWWSEWALDARELTFLASEHENPTIRRRAALILHRRRQRLPESVVVRNLSDSDYLVREWTAHTQVRDEARVLSREQLAEHLESEQHPRVIEWLIPGVGQRSAEDDDWVIGRALVNGDPGVLESAVSTFVPGLSKRGGDLAHQLLEEAEDPVVLWRTIEQVSERPDAADFGLENALDKLSGHNGFETIATELTLKGMSPATISVISKISADAGVQRIFSALNGQKREEVIRMLKEVPESYVATIAVVIALREELKSFFEVFGESYVMDRDLSTGDDYFQFTYSGPLGQVAVYVACNDRKGLENATRLTSAVLRHCRPSAVVSLGISGSLNPDDVPLGCVVVGETTEAYLSNSKVQDDMNGGYTLRRAGETYSTDTMFADRLRRLDLTHRGVFARGESRLAELTGVDGNIVVKGGPLAAGPSVVDSTVFREWMLEQQRDFKAVDMESAGVAAAAHGDGVERARLVVLRGISDLAAAKAESDAVKGGGRRSSAMLAACVVLAVFLEAEYKVSVWS